jgi:hypothetical protein
VVRVLGQDVGVSDPRRLPPGYDHPHASEEARRLAEEGMILRAQVGSGVHGTSISGQDDRDEMGICLEPPEFVTGLVGYPPACTRRRPRCRSSSTSDTPSGTAPGGWPTAQAPVISTWSSTRHAKWARLALAGNPTVLLLLFVPDEEVVYRNDAGAELIANADRFVSRLAAQRFLGYLAAQRSAMTGETGARTNRPNWSPSMGTTPSTRCMPCAWACRVSSC